MIDLFPATISFFSSRFHLAFIQPQIHRKFIAQQQPFFA